MISRHYNFILLALAACGLIVLVYWPGLSGLLVEAVLQRDYPVVQGIVIVISVIFILINIIVDISYGLLDPRVRTS